MEHGQILGEITLAVAENGRYAHLFNLQAEDIARQNSSQRPK